MPAPKARKPVQEKPVVEVEAPEPQEEEPAPARPLGYGNMAEHVRTIYG
jgi:hypothetical protein